MSDEVFTRKLHTILRTSERSYPVTEVARMENTSGQSFPRQIKMQFIQKYIYNKDDNGQCLLRNSSLLLETSNGRRHR